MDNKELIKDISNQVGNHKKRKQRKLLGLFKGSFQSLYVSINYNSYIALRDARRHFKFTIIPQFYDMYLTKNESTRFSRIHPKYSEE